MTQWLLPTPGGPTRSTFIFSRTKRGSQLTQAHTRQFWIEAPVEIREVLDLGDARLFQAALAETIGPDGELIADEEFEKLQVREMTALRLRDACLHHAGETELFHLSFERRVHEFTPLLGRTRATLRR